MSAPNDGGPAFPTPTVYRRAGEVFADFGAPGATLRDYFAKGALTGVLADPSVRIADDEQRKGHAEAIWAMADAMLATREGKATPDWKKVAQQLAAAVESAFREAEHLDSEGTRFRVCSRCGDDVAKHNPDTCEVAAALRAYEEAKSR